MTDYQKANRPDLAILDVLLNSADPTTLVDLHKHICAQTEWVSLGALVTWNERLVAAGYVTRSYHPRGGGIPVYAITNKGRAHLIVADTHSIFHDHLKEEPVYATVCHRPEAPEATEASEPPTALLCVDEDELDAWWDALEVEAKADAFVQWSLGNDGRNSHVYIEPQKPISVPVAGTVGESAEESNAKAERSQVHIHADMPSDDEMASFLRKNHKTIIKAMRDVAADLSAKPPTAPMKCDYCGGHDYPFEVRLGEGDEVLGAACRKPGCGEQFDAQFYPQSVRSAQ